MSGRKEELEEFKSKIDLRSYALGRGYEMDPVGSSKNSAVLEQGGDKVVVARNGNGHWIYFSVRDDSDHGTIIDFVQNRDRISIGEVRKELRGWSGEGEPVEEELKQLPLLEVMTKDFAMVKARYLGTSGVVEHAYLEDDRKIPVKVLKDPRFHEKIRIDRRRNAIFPHFNREGVCGYEIKNRGFTGFAPGGQKGLWYSGKGEGPENVLVIAETAIDALSYAALFPNENARYASTAGSLNPVQPELIKGMFEKMGEGRVIVAVDNDDGGDSLLKTLKDLHAEVGLAPALCLMVDRPEIRGDDWNAVLQARD